MAFLLLLCSQLILSSWRSVVPCCHHILSSWPSVLQCSFRILSSWLSMVPCSCHILISCVFVLQRRHCFLKHCVCLLHSSQDVLSMNFTHLLGDLRQRNPAYWSLWQRSRLLKGCLAMMSGSICLLQSWAFARCLGLL